MYSKIEFTRLLRLALRNLYNPVELVKNPLWLFLPENTRSNTPSSLRELLVNAIHTLKPEESLSQQSLSWRIYRTLTHRFIDQFSQAEVAINLGISIRQIRRQEKQALEALTDYFWSTYQLDKLEHQNSGTNEMLTTSELSWLEKSIPSQTIPLVELFEPVLRTLQPLITRSEAKISLNLPIEPIEIDVQKTSIHQVLVTLLTHAILSGPKTEIHINAITKKSTIQINITCVEQTHPSQPQSIPVINTQTKQLLDHLITLSKGKFELSSPESNHPFYAVLSFPLQTRMPVLFIDDNHDTLNLFRRYLESTHYFAMTTTQIEEGIQIAVTNTPKVIFIDVMMPEVDGWELLERLREHPTLSNIPLVVCSIIPNKQLALELGAAAFLQKPINRKSLLQLLDHLTESLDS